MTLSPPRSARSRGFRLVIPVGALLGAVACGGSSSGTPDGQAGQGGGGTGGGGTGGGGGVGGTGGGADGGAGSGNKDLGTCTFFPKPPSTTPTGLEDEWNRDVSGDPVDANSDNYMAKMNAASTKLHPDWGSNPTYGIPWIAVSGGQAKVPVTFTYADDSDPGPYPIPMDAPIEGGTGSKGDRHILVVDRDNCILYETWDSHYVGPGWMCGSGAIFDLKLTRLRMERWTSADAAGLPILPGLARRDEAMSGTINHALRFTVVKTQKAYIHPATHWASSDTDVDLPPMGLRVRLKKSFDVSTFDGGAKVILVALQKYGMFVADNGSDWYISGETNPAWDDTDIDHLKKVPASAFEVVKTGTIVKP